MKKIIFPFLLICLHYHFSISQQRKYATENPKAIKEFENGLKCFNNRYNEKALQYMDNALDEDPAFADAQIMKGTIYESMSNSEKAIEAYRKALLMNPDYFPNTFYTLGKLEFKATQFDSAKVHFEKFLTYKDIRSELATRADLYLRSAVFAVYAVRHPVPFEPVNMGDSINTSAEEYFPAITADGKTFLFTRKLRSPDEYGRMIDQEDFYVSTFTNNHWTKAQPISEINTTGNEGAPALSADGQYLFFTACAALGGNLDQGAYPGHRKGKGSCDIFISKKVGDKYREPRNLGEPVNSGLWESQPSFSSDGRTLYFIRASRDKDGKGNRDIFMTHINDSSQWSVPVPLSDKINTPGNEESVCIHPDDQTLYFSSDGHPGMGGLDIFMSKRQPDGSWGEPVNLGYPINTADDENSLLVSPSGNVAYFASDRKGGKGLLDLYQFDLYKEARPEMITYMKGKVFDANTKQPLFASFELIDLATAKPVIRSTSNSGNGEFLVCVPAGKNYALNVSKDGYMFYSENFEVKNPKSAKDPVLKDVAMHPIKAGESVVLKNIFYETGLYNLKDESKAELGKLVEFMNKNPKVKIEISGHTDNVGTKQSNQVLSENRAKSVVDYLAGKGIESSRITFKGYADTKPVASNNTEEGKAQNRRTEFAVISIN